MNFWKLNEAIKEEMRLDPGLVLDSERVRFINDALEEIAKLHLLELPYTHSTSAQYPILPTGLEKVRALYWEGNRLRSVASDVDLVSTGTPLGYVLEADAIRLYPKPTAEGELRWIYTGTPTKCTEADFLKTSSTSPNIPESWHTLLIDYACYRSHRKNGNILMSREYKKDFDNNMSASIRAYISSLNSQVVEGNAPETGGGDY